MTQPDAPGPDEGGGGGRTPAGPYPPVPNTGRTRRLFCSTTLVLEAFVVYFAVLAARGTSGVSTTTLLVGGAVVFLLCLVTAGLLRRSWGYALGTVVQVLLIASGAVVPLMFAIGVLFAALWIIGYRLGGRLDAEKAARGG